MNCDRLERRWLAGAAIGTPELAAHLAACSDCRAFAARLAEFRDGVRARRVDIEPDAAFAVRVVERLLGTAELLGWASLRLLPVALALALVLAWMVHLDAPRRPGLQGGAASEESVFIGLLAGEEAP